MHTNQIPKGRKIDLLMQKKKNHMHASVLHAKKVKDIKGINQFLKELSK
jgi:hypothetical protein